MMHNRRLRILQSAEFDCTYPGCDCPISWNGDGLVPESVCPKGLIVEAAAKPAREALERALSEKEPLTNVVILSQRQNGDIFYLVSDGLTVADVDWIIDSYNRRKR